MHGFQECSRQKRLYNDVRMHFKEWYTHASFEKNAHVNQIRFMLYHERERKNKENANFVDIVYLLAKLCNIFDEAFFIDVSTCFGTKKNKRYTPANPSFST